jgi:hypothetical protein
VNRLDVSCAAASAWPPSRCQAPSQPAERARVTKLKKLGLAAPPDDQKASKMQRAVAAEAIADLLAIPAQKA